MKQQVIPLLLCALGVKTAVAGNAAAVVSVTNASYTSNVLTITGTNLNVCTSSPKLSINNVPLTVTVHSGTVVTATFPPKNPPSGFAPGIYTAQLSFNAGRCSTSTSFPIALGQIGPQGPAGPTGPQGVPGPMGLPGAIGGPGPTGPVGTTGPAGQSITYQGVWNSAAVYSTGEAVSFNGSSYISLLSNNVNLSPDANPTAWSLMAQKGATGAQGPVGSTGPQGAPGLPGAMGPQGSMGLTGPAGPVGPQGPTGTTGPAGQSITYQGVWNSAAVYSTGQAVSFNGSSYISLLSNNSNLSPDANPTAWSLMAQKGAQGATGAQGPMGSNGPQGAPGLPGAIGPQGPIGLTGPAGRVGPQGPTGATGPAGMQGLPGAQGPAGIGGVLIVDSASHSYPLYKDGALWNYNGTYMWVKVVPDRIAPWGSVYYASSDCTGTLYILPDDNFVQSPPIVGTTLYYGVGPETVLPYASIQWQNEDGSPSCVNADGISARLAVAVDLSAYFVPPFHIQAN